MGQLKAFLIGTIKIAIALFLVVIAITGVIWGWTAFSENREKAQNAPLAEPKKWPPTKLEPLDNVTVSLVTKWSDGSLYYQLTLDGYPKALEKARGDSKSAFHIDFFDSAGFKVFSHEVGLRTMTQLVKPDGRAYALSDNSQTRITAENYRLASRWEVGWNFPTTVEPEWEVVQSAKPKPETPKWRNITLWRQMNRQMSKEQVQQLLGPPTKIENAGVLVFWHYGYPIGGEVTFDSAGAIHGWREP